jgi:hypothetical protein
MESHDEERLMYKNLLYSNTTPDYPGKELRTSLARMRAATTLFYTIPGPKMLWQFGELGYDISINQCPNGSNDPGCRVSAKPVHWDYYEDSHRRWLYDHIRDLNDLRRNYRVFTSGTASFSSGSSLTKQVMLKGQPYTANPTGADNMNAVVVANFDATERTMTVSFPHPGAWYDYYASGEAPLQVSGASLPIRISPGGYKIYTDIQVASTVVTGVSKETDHAVGLYPNPASKYLKLALDDNVISEIKLDLLSLNGLRFTPEKISDDTWDVGNLSRGLYIAEIRTRRGIHRLKVVLR